MNYPRRVSDFLPPLNVGDRLELLFYCIRFSLYAGLPPLDRYLDGILIHPNSVPKGGGYCGGDPGWEIDGNNDETGGFFYNENGEQLFRCWALADVSDIEPDTAYYTVKEVRYYIRLALENIGKKYPEHLKEAQEVIARYGL
ncbi:hypothetical protein [Herbaspirillum sp. alder98]|uniref:hypothetical protein n=1 Tax=Herbaspirillum sp. alder98 TaxID=2913096 RepID=UPI001CD8E768|nr:hypothetical protein [Herbaspirillum sp. alder98]MCA1324079.1 hypothetical protein [Herbaspirillum sp. alder98]